MPLFKKGREKVLTEDNNKNMNAKEECNRFGDYLYNYFTCNNKCAHHIEKPYIFFHQNKNLIRFSYVYLTDEIEYKINNDKLKWLIIQYFKDNEDFNKIIKNTKYYIIEKIGPKKNKTNITIDFKSNKSDLSKSK